MLGSGTETLRHIDPRSVKKTVLARQVGEFLNQSDRSPESRDAIENLARVLANDISETVRGTLAFEVRLCKDLPYDLAERIARDVESVSVPFLATTPALSDEQLVELIPIISEYGRVALARRSDLGAAPQVTIAQVGEEPSVTYLVRNPSSQLDESGYMTVVDRFGTNERLMSHLGERPDLPMVIVEEIIDKVTDACRVAIIRHYGVDAATANRLTTAAYDKTLLRRTKNANREQLTALAIDLRNRRKLTHDLILTFGEGGSLAFVESALAVLAGTTVEHVKQALSLTSKQDFAQVLKDAGVQRDDAHRYLDLAQAHFSKKE